ncbi:MAG: FtsX-like permease family protein [Planctomycetota bacterium]|nr:FtsX-like permease family protein [Planctomycetota bacterium]
MSLWRLVLKELRHRKGNFALSLLSVSVAIATLAGALTLLRAHRQRTESLIAEKQAQVEAAAAKMEDEIRKITKNLGFNILILPKDQDLQSVYAEGFAEKTMPEAYAARLADANVVTIAHILPSLTRKFDWEEARRTVILIGTRGEVGEQKKPLLAAVPPGKLVLGYELHRQLNLKEGDSVGLKGRTFTVHKCYPARGSKDDITVWMDLAEAQQMLDMAGRINAILALECNCATLDRLAEIRAEVAGILPDTQVVEFQSQAVARAEARNLATAKALADLELEKRHREAMQREGETLAAWLVPLVLLGCAVWIGVLALVNVKSRLGEIGILRALGVRSGQILFLFLGKALLTGVLGATAGFGLGYGLCAAWNPGAGDLFDARVLALSLGLAPVLAAAASWIPAQIAARQDPAAVLRED